MVAWGDGGYGQLEVPFGTFRDVDANSLGNTAVRSDGTLAFWGYYGHGQYNWPTGDGFVKAFGGAVMSMAMRADGSLVAWGGNNFLQVSGTPAGPGFQSFAEGYGACMALRADGSIVAWGMEQYGSGNAGLIAACPRAGVHNHGGWLCSRDGDSRPGADADGPAGFLGIRCDGAAQRHAGGK